MYVLMHWKIATIIPIRLGEICMTWEYDPAADNKRFRSFFKNVSKCSSWSDGHNRDIALYAIEYS